MFLTRCAEPAAEAVAVRSFWSDRMYRLVSLMELLRFHAQTFYWASGTLAQVFTQLRYGHPPGQEAWGQCASTIRQLIEESERLGFPSIAIEAKRVREAVTERGVLDRGDLEEFARLLMGLHTRIMDDLGAVLFLHVPNRQAVFYQAPLDGWETVISRIPAAQVEIEEAGKCFALSRYTAAVFHLMRLMEMGLDALIIKLGLPTHLPSWDAKLKKIEEELDRLSADRTSVAVSFSRQVRANYRAVQTAWRNPTMHVEKTYTEEMAAEIMAAVKSFIRHVVQEL